jgi:hypothetical protein
MMSDEEMLIREACEEWLTVNGMKRRIYYFDYFKAGFDFGQKEIEKLKKQNEIMREVLKKICYKIPSQQDMLILSKECLKNVEEVENEYS